MYSHGDTLLAYNTPLGTIMPTGHTVHPSPKTIEGGFIFFAWCLKAHKTFFVFSTFS